MPTNKGGPWRTMRRSPAGLSCLMGLDLQRKRPLSDLTPEDEEPEAPPPSPAVVVVDMTLAVEETPSCAHATGSIHNSGGECKR